MSNFKACNECKAPDSLEWIATVAEVVVFQCTLCHSTFQFPKPEDWKEPGMRPRDVASRIDGRTTVNDITPKEAAQKLVQDLGKVDPTKIDESFIKISMAGLVLQTLAANLASKRPTVRQRAAESLCKIMFKPAQQSVDVTSGGKAMSVQTTEGLIALTQGMAARLMELAEKEANGPDTD